MANKILDDLAATVTKTEGVEDSAIAFIKGVPALIQAAVTQALANGASEAELAPFAQLNTELNAKADALAAAIVA
jgi:hypothetical protein